VVKIKRSKVKVTAWHNVSAAKKRYKARTGRSTEL